LEVVRPEELPKNTSHPPKDPGEDPFSFSRQEKLQNAEKNSILITWDPM
jgi:hypothetical protein